MVGVYLGIFFVLLFVGIMQTPLNTHPFILYSLLRRILSTSKTSVLFSLALLLSGLAFPTAANAIESDFYKDFIIINGTYYYTNLAVNGFSSFDGKYFGEFDRSNGSLTLGAEANTFTQNNDNIQPPQLFYRVYLENTAPPTEFTALNLGFLVAGADNGSNNKRWNNTSNKLNLVATTSTPGVYVLEVYFRSDKNYNSNNFIFDSRGGANYKGYFKVNGTLPQWDGSESNSWFNADNWTPRGVPDDNTDAVVSFMQNGRYPIITGGVAQVRTLTVNGEPNNPNTTTLLQTGGTLQVFGNFNKVGTSFKQSGGVFTLAGSNTQAFDGTDFKNVTVQGGSDKYLRGRMNVAQSLSFQSGRLVTSTDEPSQLSVDLAAGATVTGESETSYVLGVLRSLDQVVSQDNVISFGNIGVDLLSTNGNPGNTAATRITGPNDFAYSGVGTSKSIRRGFSFAPANSSTFTVNLAFHYLDTELQGIPEENLLLFRSITGSVPFDKLGKSSLDQTNNTLIQENIIGTLNATFTLGNSANPLPVTIASFTAVAQGADAVLNWTTASETNNQGFEVQVSTDGTNFSKLSFLAANTPNSTTSQNYQYRDVTAGKQGTRYYRLRQLDLDGSESFLGPRVVTFGGVAQATSLQGYPSPFSSEINLALQTTAAGLATVTVTDGVGRQVRSWQPTLAAGASSLRLAELQSMPAGLYVVQVRYNDGQTQRLKMVKE